MKKQTCRWCGKKCLKLTYHHIKPQQFRGKETKLICQDCHDTIHKLRSNAELMGMTAEHQRGLVLTYNAEMR
jgi:hypothetical protein